MNLTTAHHRDLSSYLQGVYDAFETTVRQAGLHPDQVTALLPRKRPRPLAHPLAPFYFAVRAHGAKMGRDADLLGAGFLMFHHALGIIDNVQDEELEGDWLAMGPAVAFNHGLTLFYLGTDTLQRGAALGGWSLGDTLRYNTLRLCSGQHRDIIGRGRPDSPEGALATATDKAAVYALLLELAVRYVNRPRTVDPAPYRQIGDRISMIQQIVDDIADLLDGAGSHDLRNGTWNVPLTLLLDSLPTEQRADWLVRLPDSGQQACCQMLYQTGAMARLAKMTEAARVAVHRGLAELPMSGPYLAMLLAWLDDLVALFYRPRVLNICPEIHDLGPVTLAGDDDTLFRQLQGARRVIPSDRPAADVAG